MKIKSFITNGLLFDNGTTLKHYHDQDCCEHVYADWKYLKNYNILPSTGKSISIYDVEFSENIVGNIEFEKSMGIKLISKTGDKWFIPCYNEQNGYYSSDLELIIYAKDKPTIKIDITDYVEDRID